MNKPYQRDEVEQKQDYEGAKRELKQNENERLDSDKAQSPEKSGGEEE